MNINQTQPVKLAARANKCLCLGHTLIMRKVTVYQRPSPCGLAQQNHMLHCSAKHDMFAGVSWGKLLIPATQG